MTTQGYFFVGDLLGFSRLVANLDQEQLGRRVDGWVTLIEEAAASTQISRLQMISDTVFAATDPTADGLRQLVTFARTLLERGVPLSLPVRGAISFGEFTWGRLTYGKAVVASHQLEMKQQWIGVACHPGLPHVSELWSPSSLVCYPAPMSTGKVTLQPVVAWPVPQLGVLTKALSGHGLTRDGDQMDWEWAHKVGNTIQFRLYLRFLEKTAGKGKDFLGIHPLHVIDESLGGAV